MDKYKNVVIIELHGRIVGVNKAVLSKRLFLKMESGVCMLAQGNRVFTYRIKLIIYDNLLIIYKDGFLMLII